MHIVIASKNVVKSEAVRRGFERVFSQEIFTFEGIPVPSGVSDQPMGDEETVLGARNRLAAVERERPEADIWVAIEGGCMDTKEGIQTFAWVALRSRDGQTGLGRTGVFYLPPAVATLVRQGVELGLADDQVFGRTNSKEKNGAVGILTGNVIDRTEYYAHAVILALVGLKNPELYS